MLRRAPPSKLHAPALPAPCMQLVLPLPLWVAAWHRAPSPRGDSAQKRQPPRFCFDWPGSASLCPLSAARPHAGVSACGCTLPLFHVCNAGEAPLGPHTKSKHSPHAPRRPRGRAPHSGRARAGRGRRTAGQTGAGCERHDAGGAWGAGVRGGGGGSLSPPRANVGREWRRDCKKKKERATSRLSFRTGCVPLVCPARVCSPPSLLSHMSLLTHARAPLTARPSAPAARRAPTPLRAHT